ncbi:MAG: hypothetical protein ACLR0N_13235 [Bilophila wadsworthia]
MRRDFCYRIHVISHPSPAAAGAQGGHPLLVEHFLKAYPSNKRFSTGQRDAARVHAL